MYRVLKIALVTAAVGFASVPAQAVEVIGCGGGSACLSGTTNVNLVTAEDTTLGLGTIGIGGSAVTFTTDLGGTLDLDASGQATISDGIDGTTLTQLTFNVLAGFTGAEFNLNPLVGGGQPIQFGVSITTDIGGTTNFVSPLGDQRFAVIAGAGETIRSVTLTSAAGFGTFTQLRIGQGIVAQVPEPGTWAMMLIGFGGMGVALRRRRKLTNIAQLA